MITHLGSPGDTLVPTRSSTPQVAAHAAREADGDLNVMLINEDPANEATVDLTYDGFTPSRATPTVYSYLKNASSIGSAPAGSAATQTVPAYGIVVVHLEAGGADLPCTVDYRVAGQWQGGFQGEITLSCTAALDGWQLAFAFPDGQTIRSLWGGTFTQSGAAVTVRPADWNRAIPAGGSVRIGFTGARDGGNAPPENFTLTEA
ncbi:hypothetical protein D7294_08000 [Streptomyces hoynatensis]|uniref:CBM2 domain-containing protein n=2 Tax=Streptomyces hoynatensis TaxID=1141874 RepID=A0A3A9Z9S6_9ACTN|nr:hypothetical protein D7294_08000 [Streptomyces hoynatensis]